MILDEGEFNNILFKKSINNIRGTNIFKKVSDDLVSTDDNSLKDINITVEEQLRTNFSWSWCWYFWCFNCLWCSESNFLGKGIKLNSNLSLSEETIKGLFLYKPNFNNTDRDLILSLQSQETDSLIIMVIKHQTLVLE